MISFFKYVQLIHHRASHQQSRFIDQVLELFLYVPLCTNAGSKLNKIIQSSLLYKNLPRKFSYSNLHRFSANILK